MHQMLVRSKNALDIVNVGICSVSDMDLESGKICDFRTPLIRIRDFTRIGILDIEKKISLKFFHELKDTYFYFARTRIDEVI